MQVQTYLMMDGRTEEAIEFYKKTFDATVTSVLRAKDAPEGACKAGSENSIMHAHMMIGETAVMLSDGYNNGAPKFEGFALTIATKTEAEADKLFNALADGGTVTMPQAKSFFSPRFGMLKDKFGVHWTILVGQ
jgi:PhnB protein